MSAQTLDKFTQATAPASLVSLLFLRDEELTAPKSRSCRLYYILSAIHDGFTVASIALTSPTSLTPSPGDRYIVAATAGGAWAAQENKIAIYVSSNDGWAFLAPSEGWSVFDQNTNKTYIYSGSAWAEISASTISADTAALGISGENVQAALESVDSLKATKASPTFTGVPVLPSYTVSSLPSATEAGAIYVSDETGGAVLAFADGTNWRRSTDRAIVS